MTDDVEDRKRKIAIIDPGTQYGVLYAKRFWDMWIQAELIDAGVFHSGGELVRPRITYHDVKGYAGVVIAGGRSSVLDKDDRVDIDPGVFAFFNDTMLCTCLGHQLQAITYGGQVEHGIQQCGPVYTRVDTSNPLFKGLDVEQRVNETHNDGVSIVPPEFRIIAISDNELGVNGAQNIEAIFRSPQRGKRNYRFGTSFHPETFLTENGLEMLANFARLCKLEPKLDRKRAIVTPDLEGKIQDQYKTIREIAGELPVVVGISGGVDSTVATKALLEAGIPKSQIKAFHIDTGFNRYEESEEVVKQYHELGWDFVELIDRKDFFANYSLTEEQIVEYTKGDKIKSERLCGKGFGGINLKSAVYSEHKRLIFQVAYAEVISEYLASKGLDETNSILVQGTNQADRVESSKGGKVKSGSASIKSHHNVGKFSEKYEAEGHLLEPLKMLYKSDIYRLAKITYDLTKFFSTRMPFPGPGLLVRMGNHNMVESGKYTQQQVDDLSKRANKFSNIHGVQTYVTPLEAVGNSGDERAEGIMSVLQPMEEGVDVVDQVNNLKYVAGQLGHYTTFSRQNCLTRFMMPLFSFDSTKTPSFTEMSNGEEHTQYLKVFDHEVDQIVRELGLDENMTQLVNYMISDNFGEEGKYTFVFRPWQAPDLMSGVPLLPENPKIMGQLVDRLRSLKEKHDFIGNVCIDLTYKPIGGTEIN